MLWDLYYVLEFVKILLQPWTAVADHMMSVFSCEASYIFRNLTQELRNSPLALCGIQRHAWTCRDIQGHAGLCRGIQWCAGNTDELWGIQGNTGEYRGIMGNIGNTG